jgi:hypothetical protein
MGEAREKRVFTYNGSDGKMKILKIVNRQLYIIKIINFFVSLK